MITDKTARELFGKWLKFDTSDFKYGQIAENFLAEIVNISHNCCGKYISIAEYISVVFIGRLNVKGRGNPRSCKVVVSD